MYSVIARLSKLSRPFYFWLIEMETWPLFGGFPPRPQLALAPDVQPNDTQRSGDTGHVSDIVKPVLVTNAGKGWPSMSRCNNRLHLLCACILPDRYESGPFMPSLVS
jgi:hypothetical protein